MSKEIIKVKREDNGAIDIETVENMNMLELFNVTKNVVAIVIELMVADLDIIETYKHKKALKDILCQAIDESYIYLKEEEN